MRGAADFEVRHRTDRFPVQRNCQLRLDLSFIRRDTERENGIARLRRWVLEPHVPDRHMPGMVGVLANRHLEWPVAILALPGNERDAASSCFADLLPEAPLPEVFGETELRRRVIRRADLPERH